jgi:hypothetical protein
MPRITPQEAGRRGGLIGGKSRSAAKLAAARRNGFQKLPAAPPDLMDEFLRGGPPQNLGEKPPAEQTISFSE